MNIYYDDLLDRVFTEGELETILGHPIEALDEQALAGRYRDEQDIRAILYDTSPGGAADASRILVMMHKLHDNLRLLQFPVWIDATDQFYFEEDIDALLDAVKWKLESSPFAHCKPQLLHEKLRLVELVAWGHVADAAVLADWVLGDYSPDPEAATFMHHGELIRRLGEAIQEREDEHAH
jgi:hypothetical protein